MHLSKDRTKYSRVKALFVAGCFLGACCCLVQAQSKVTPEAHREAVRLNNLGTALVNQQLLDGAVLKFDEAARLEPTLACAELNKGLTLIYLQKMAEASVALTRASELAPDDPHVWYALGLLYRSENETAKGIESFRRVLRLVPNNADSHYFVGSLELGEHNLDEAIVEFREALRVNPLHPSAEFGLARALQRKGDAAGAHAALQQFQHLTSTKVVSPLTHNYGEEGQLGTVEVASSGAAQVGSLIPIAYERLSPTGAMGQGAGLMTRNGLGQGSCLIDVDGSGQQRIVVMGHGANAVRMYRFLAGASGGTGSLGEIAADESGLSATGEGVACASGDFDNDGLTDLVLAMSDRIVLFRNMGGGRFKDVTRAVGIVPVNRPTGVIFVDFDHDGDLDVFVTGRGLNGAIPNVLWRNNGNQTFTNWTEQSGLGGKEDGSGAVLSDINNDRAVDLLVTGSGGSPTVYFNPRDGAFSPMRLYPEGSLTPTVGASVLDFNKDGWMDIALIHAGSPGVSLWRNVDGKHFERVPLPLRGVTSGWGVTALDIDNDGWIDLAVGVSTKTGPSLRVFRNVGAAGFEDVTAKVKLDGLRLKGPMSLRSADVDGDGAADLIVTQREGEPVVLLNKGGNVHHSVEISLKGLADNKSGIGAKVEVFADGMWQKWEVTSPQAILAGVGTSDRADLVRLLWPTGVPQDEIDVAAGVRRTLAELDRRGSSCPTLFAWDGTKYSFVADVIGAGVVGHWTGPARRNIPDPDEWIKIDGSQLQAKGGRLSLRFGEPMEEVNFVDQVRLVAVDHPAGTEVYPNERFLSEPPFAATGTIFSDHAHPLRGAWDDQGKDVLGLLRTRDHQYVQDFTNLAFAGFANRHTLTLDLGEWTAANPLRLLLHGFVEYFSASSMYSAWQSGITPTPPYVEAELPDGSWKRVVDDMGFPAGLPRTVVADLTGKLPVGTKRIRLVTNLQIYWDQILVDNGPQRRDAELHETELALDGAQLAFRGYPEQIDGKTAGDLTYNYERMSHTGPFIAQRGAYTRYGEVTPLLKAVDNKFVIFGTGEDMDLEFSTAAQPWLPSGWVRDYFFYANGFVKDMDFYEASPFTVSAMPFHGMTGYPYSSGEHYPTDAEHTAYQLEWNDRFENGAAPKPFRFQYEPQVSEPQMQGAGGQR